MGGAKYLGLTANQLARIASDLDAENAMLWEELTASSQCETCEAMLDCDECLRANDSVKERKGLDFENAKLRELVQELYEDQCDECDRWRYRDRMAQLGMEVDG